MFWDKVRKVPRVAGLRHEDEGAGAGKEDRGPDVFGKVP